MTFNLLYFFFLANILFFIGLIGLSYSKISNFYLLIAVEIIFMSVNLNFFFSAIYVGNVTGFIFIFYVIIVSGAELAIFLSFFIVYYKKVFLLDITENFKNIKF